MTIRSATSTGRGGEEPLGRPLLLSAAAHLLLLLLSAWYLIGGVAAPFSPVRIVHVLLVDANEGTEVPTMPVLPRTGPVADVAGRTPASPSPAADAVHTAPSAAEPSRVPPGPGAMDAPERPADIYRRTGPVGVVAPPMPAAPSPSTETGQAVSSMAEHSRDPERPERMDARERSAMDGRGPGVAAGAREGPGAFDGAGAADTASGAGRAAVSLPPASRGSSGESTGSSVAAGEGGGRGGGSRGGAAEEGAIGRLREKIQSRIVYPEEAIRRGQEGEVLLRIRIGEDGSARDVRVARSSGARILDDAARTGVVRAAPLPSSPGWIEVPVRFRLHRSLRRRGQSFTPARETNTL